MSLLFCHLLFLHLPHNVMAVDMTACNSGAEKGLELQCKIFALRSIEEPLSCPHDTASLPLKLNFREKKPADFFVKYYFVS